MNRLERHLGHFYNWYGTLDLRPLEPEYISSVDSGNLAGHLIALWNACRRNGPAAGDGGELACRGRGSAGIAARVPAQSAPATGSGPLLARLNGMTEALRSEAASPAGVSALLGTLALLAAPIPALVRALPAGGPSHAGARLDAVIWADALIGTILGHQRSLAALMPWAGLAEVDLAADTALADLTAEMPTLAGLPALCAVAVAVSARLSANVPAAPDPLRKRRGGTSRTNNPSPRPSSLIRHRLGPRRPASGAGCRRAQAVRRHGVRLPVRSRARVALDRLSRRGWQPRSELL